MSAGGRPCKLTPEVQEAICERLRKGMPRNRAARRSRVGETTFNRWMATGAAAEAAYEAGEETDEESAKFREFRRAVLDAEDDCVEKDLGVVDECVESDDERVKFAAAKWRLSYRYRDDFAQRREQTGPDGGPVAVAAEVTGRVAVGLFTADQLVNMAPEQLEAALRGLGVTEEEP